MTDMASGPEDFPFTIETRIDNVDEGAVVGTEVVFPDDRYNRYEATFSHGHQDFGFGKDLLPQTTIKVSGPMARTDPEKSSVEVEYPPDKSKHARVELNLGGHRSVEEIERLYGKLATLLREHL
jgi:hypothetical protein